MIPGILNKYIQLVFLISSYGAPLAQRAYYLAQFALWAT